MIEEYKAIKDLCKQARSHVDGGKIENPNITLKTSIVLSLIAEHEALSENLKERCETVKLWIQADKQSRDYAITLQKKLDVAERALTATKIELYWLISQCQARPGGSVDRAFTEAHEALKLIRGEK